LDLFLNTIWNPGFYYCSTYYFIFSYY